MGRLKTVFVLAFGAAVILFYAFSQLPLLFFRSPYLSFTRQNQSYYSDVARACDLILRQHPVTTNDVVKLSSSTVAFSTIKLPPNDSSVPKIIRKWHPDMILVGSNRLVIEIPPERMGGFVFAWEQDDRQTNLWTLSANGDGVEKTVFQEIK